MPSDEEILRRAVALAYQARQGGHDPFAALLSPLSLLLPLGGFHAWWLHGEDSVG